MDRRHAARELGGSIGDVAGRFMLDPATYAHGGELGFSGFDFYMCGRGGVLGPVPGDVVAAAFTFLGPDAVRAGWDAGSAVMAPGEAADAFMATGHRWGREHLHPDLPADRFAELALRVVDGADPSACCLFAAWRCAPRPDDDRALALHAAHLLRELRGGAHAAAVRAAGLTPHQAVVVRGGPTTAQFLGWPTPHPDTQGLRGRWEAAEAATDTIVCQALAVLDDDEVVELVDLATALAG